MFQIQSIKKIFLTGTLAGALFVLPLLANAQENQTTPPPNKTDTINLLDENGNLADGIDTLVKGNGHNPRIAIISSAIVPGLGQVYNQKYWKVPIIYGVGAGLYYGFDFNQSKYIRYKQAYSQMYNDETVTDDELADLSITQLELGRDYYRRYRDYVVIFMGLLYVANIVDAMVDAYLFKYDISRDLSLQLEPTIMQPDPNSLMATGGLKLSLKF